MGKYVIKYKKVDLSDKKWMELLITMAKSSGSHINFTNIFAWSQFFRYRVARINDFLVVKGRLQNGEHYYFYPAGKGDPKTIIEILKEDAAECEHEFLLLGLSLENANELERMIPESFEYQEMRDSFDYVYILEKLITLSGKKLHSKRNHINRFKENNVWSFEQISSENLTECWEMNELWCKENRCKEDKLLAIEDCAVQRCFNNFTALGLEGGLIRSGGRVIAYTMGEKLNSTTYIIHIEKAFSKIQGAYQIINREFAFFIKENHPQLIYVNREEDMGDEGLRRAKLSYQPDKYEEKFMAKYILD